MKLLLCGFLGVCASGYSSFHLSLDLATTWFTETGKASKGIQIRVSVLTRNVLAVSSHHDENSKYILSELKSDIIFTESSLKKIRLSRIPPPRGC